ncbi:hypothetical protein T265_15347, partial [Opisthorchis viverrini]
IDGYPVGGLTISLLGINNPRLGLPVAADGHLGLGYPESSRTVPDFNILNVMSANQMIDYKRFTLFCVCAPHRNDLEPDARIVFGSHDTIDLRSFRMVPAEVTRASWKVPVTSLKTTTARISSRSFFATLDTTTWLNKASADRAGLINTALGTTLSGNLYVVDCDRIPGLPTLVVSLQGADLRFPPENYIQKEEVNGQTRCFSSIVPDPQITTERMVFGMTFLEHFTTLFDQQEKQIGFKPRVC